MNFIFRNTKTLTTISSITLILNVLLLKSIIIGTVFGILYLGLTGYILGSKFFNNVNHIHTRWVLGVISELTWIILLGTTFFYLWELNNLQLIIITLILTLITVVPPQKNSNNKLTPKSPQFTFSDNKRYNLNQSLLTGGYLITTIIGFIILATHTSTDAIRSPWEVIPSSFLIVYFIATIFLVLNLIKNNKQVGSKLILMSIHLFLTYSITLIVYSINFGFDPFVHQAGEKLLAISGNIYPKPFLYIGQYSLVIWLNKFISLPIIFIDKLLLPLLTSILIPPITYFTLNKGFNIKSKYSLFGALILPILLVSFFFSVPQNLANLFLLVLILLSINYSYNESPNIWQLWILGLAVLAIHPFAGIPALIYLAILSLKPNGIFIKLKNKSRYLFFILLFLLSLIILPTTLTLTGNAKNSEQIILEENIKLNIDIIDWVPFYSIFHLVYLFKNNLIFIIGILTILGLWLMMKDKKRSAAKHWSLMSLMAVFLILVINSLIIQNINLPIISYEIIEFMSRFWQIGLLFLIPIILYTFSTIIKFILQRNDIFFTYALVFFLSLATTFGTYLLYPRHDGFMKSKAYATSQADIETVKWIEQDAKNSNYVVLSNQAVSAAALYVNGFKKYYQNNSPACKYLQNPCQELFYYPIPTTSPLYDLYLDMVYKAPTKTNLEKALYMTQANIVYFVINDYWLDAQKIIKNATNEFSEPHTIRNKGRSVTIFKFKK